MSTSGVTPRDFLSEVIELASRAHEADRWGEYPYVTHLALTATKARELGGNEHVEQTAWLHDVIEDHPQYASEIKERFPALHSSLLVLAKNKDEAYPDYISRVLESGDQTALTVKLADMEVNYHHAPDKRRHAKYQSQIGRLRDAFNGTTSSK